MLRSVVANADTMLDSEPIERTESPAWVDKFQRFADWMANEPSGKDERRRRIELMFLADAKTELAEEAHQAGVTPTEMLEWIRQEGNVAIKGMPCLGLFREVLHERLLNRGTKWRDNDLVDLMYLTCAAGYADHVVGEKSLTAQMESGLRRLGRPNNVHRRLGDLCSALSTDLNRSPTGDLD